MTHRCQTTMLVGMPSTRPALPIENPEWPAANGNVIQLPTPSLRGFDRRPAVPCQREDPALWFSNVPAELDLAKAFCRGCIQRQSCLTGALDRAEAAGVWGGEIFEEGRIIAFKRPRGRPRKSQPEPAA